MFDFKTLFQNKSRKKAELIPFKKLVEKQLTLLKNESEPYKAKYTIEIKKIDE